MKICTYLIIKVITENVLFPRHQAVVSRTEQGSFNKKYFHITTSDEYIDFPHTFVWFRSWYFVDPASSPSEGRPQKIHRAWEWPGPVILTVLVAGGLVDARWRHDWCSGVISGSAAAARRQPCTPPVLGLATTARSVKTLRASVLSTNFNFVVGLKPWTTKILCLSSAKIPIFFFFFHW